MRKKIFKRTLMTAFVGVSLLANIAIAGANAASDNESEAAKEDSIEYKLPQVVVTASRDTLPGGYVESSAKIGILGDIDIMDAPFTQRAFTEKTIQNFSVPGESISSVLMLSPSVRSASSTMYNDVNIRGFRINGYQFYINGVPGLLTQTNIPTNFAESIEVMSGPAMSITGSATQESAGGLVNIVSKRAREDITNYTQTFSGRGSWGEHVDMARRFGKNKQWGIRLNAQNVSGETSLPGEKLDSRNFFLNLDHQSSKSSTNLFGGYRRVKHENGLRWFQYGSNVTRLPDAPDAKTNYSFNGQRMEYDTWMVTLNHDQKISDNWTLFLTSGYSRYDLFTNYNAQSSAYAVTNNAGDFTANNWSKTFPITSYYAQTGIKGKFETGEVKHNMALAFDKAWYNNGSGIPGSNFNTGSGNLYTGITHNNNWTNKIRGGYSAKSQYRGWSVADTMEFKKVDILLGLHAHYAKVSSYNAQTNKATGAPQSSHATSPTYGITYKPVDNLAIYASHAESFNRGTLVASTSTKTYLNDGDVIAPAKTKQNEIGVKYNNKGILTTASLFEITQSSNIDVITGAGTMLVQEGESKYKGFEASIAGKVGSKWNLTGGFMYLNAKTNKTTNASLNGTRVNGVPRWNSVLAMEYEATDKFSILGRILYNGTATINNAKLGVPSYFTFDLGVSYKTKLADIPVKINLMCYNVENKNYWITSGNTTILSSPRTFLLSAEFKF